MAINESVIQRVKETLRKIEASLYPTLKDVFEKNKDVIHFIQTEKQLYEKGEDNKALPIVPFPYANSTISIKLRKGQPTDRITLKDTGDFYNSINVIVTGNSLIIETSIAYASFLTNKYGADILGIQDMEMREFYIKYIKPEIKKNIETIIKENKI